MFVTRRALLLGGPAAVAAAQFGPKPEEIPSTPPLPHDKLPEAFAGMEWKPVYTFEEGRDQFAITAFEFVSPTLGFAAGRVTREGSIRQNRILVTTDSGKTWTPNKLPDVALSLFTLDASHVWLVTRKDLWYTSDAATKWQKLKLPKNCLRVCFSDAQTGFAFGLGKAFWRTTDGGRQWSKVPESESLALTDDRTSYSSMRFVNREIGMLGGISARADENEDRLPDWMRPDRATTRRLHPSSIVVWITRDGGKTWTSSVTSAFGKVQQIRLQGRLGAALFFFGDGFHWPSELVTIELSSGKNTSTFRRVDLRLTDMILLSGQGMMLAAIDPLGRLSSAGLPGKVRMLYSPDFKSWYQMKVDYRAEGVNLMLATDRVNGFWAATDSGMILKLER